MADSDSSEDIVNPPSVGVRMDHIRYAISLLGLKVDVNTDEGRHALLARLQSNECIIARDRCRYVQSTTNKKRSIVACLLWLEILGFDGVIADRMLTYDILKTMLTESSGLCPSDMTVSTSTGRSTGKATREQCCVHPHHYIRGSGVAALKAYMTSVKEVLAAVPGSMARVDSMLMPRLQAILAEGNGIFDVPSELFGACSLAVFTAEERAYKPINRRPGRRGHHEIDADPSEEVVIAAPPVCKSAQGSPAPRRRKVTVDSPARPATTVVVVPPVAPWAPLPPAIRASPAGSATVLHTHEETNQTAADPFSIGISLAPFDSRQSFEQLAHELFPTHFEQRTPHQHQPEHVQYGHAQHQHHPEQYAQHHPEQHAQAQYHSEQDPLLDMYDADFVSCDYSFDVLTPRSGPATMPPPLARTQSHQSLPPATLFGWDDGSHASAAASPQRTSHSLWAL